LPFKTRRHQPFSLFPLCIAAGRPLLDGKIRHHQATSVQLPSTTASPSSFALTEHLGSTQFHRTWPNAVFFLATGRSAAELDSTVARPSP
jgi:hypothetical protein